MRVKNENPVALVPESADTVIRLYFAVNHLKQLYRQGWLKEGRNVPERNCESVADHVFGMAMLALFLCDSHFKALDRHKVITMILVHELGEIEDGDQYVTSDDAKKVRYEAEKQAIVRLLAPVPGAESYIALWEEFEKNETKEARFVRELDKLEMVFQAKIYSLQHGVNLQEFFDSARSYVQSEACKRLFETLETMQRPS